MFYLILFSLIIGIILWLIVVATFKLFSDGLIFFVLMTDMYVHDIQSGITVSNIEPQILNETAATAYVDGKNVLGPVVGNFCMDVALSKSKSAGIGFVVARGKSTDIYQMYHI